MCSLEGAEAGFATASDMSAVFSALMALVRSGDHILATRRTLKSGQEAAMQLVNRLEMCSKSSNLGDTRTIVTHSASTTHSKLTEEEELAVGISRLTANKCRIGSHNRHH